MSKSSLRLLWVILILLIIVELLVLVVCPVAARLHAALLPIVRVRWQLECFLLSLLGFARHFCLFHTFDPRGLAFSLGLAGDLVLVVQSAGTLGLILFDAALHGALTAFGGLLARAGLDRQGARVSLDARGHHVDRILPIRRAGPLPRPLAIGFLHLLRGDQVLVLLGLAEAPVVSTREPARICLPLASEGVFEFRYVSDPLEDVVGVLAGEAQQR